MAKAAPNDKPDAKQHADAAERYYCEYVCQDSYWWLINSNTQPGYFCPNINERAEAFGCYPCTYDYQGYTCSDIEPIAGGVRATVREKEYFCEYEFRHLGNGVSTFLNVCGSCRDYSSDQNVHDYREYCPVDLLAFLREHASEELVGLDRALAAAGRAGLLLRVRIDPRTIHACSRDTPPHRPH